MMARNRKKKVFSEEQNRAPYAPHQNEGEGFKTYKLMNPFTDDKGFRIEAIKIRKMTLGDYVSNEEETQGFAPVKANVHLYSRLTGLSPTVLQMMSFEDWTLLQQEANSFLFKRAMTRLNSEGQLNDLPVM